MRLIECHIAGFGAFKDYTLSFDEGLNVIMQPNGWGKTTIAAYIKAMLYGLDRKRKRDVSENDRLRYKPWSGGKYGGTLDVEFAGQELRIVRTFGATHASDKCQVIDIETGRPMQLNGAEPGEWMFGLDCAAFQKSVFVGQNGFGADVSTAGLRNRLNAFVNEADDVAGLDRAKAALDERRKHYVKTGNRGRIAEVGQQMARLLDASAEQDMQVSELARLQASLQQLDEQARALEAQAQKAQSDLDEARKGASDLEALAEVRAGLVEQEGQARKALVAFEAQAGKLPGEHEMESMRKACDMLARRERELADANAQAEQAQAGLAQIADAYAGKLPVRSEVEARASQLQAWRRDEGALAAASAQQETTGFEQVEAAVAVDPTFVESAKRFGEGWPRVCEALEQGRQAQMRLDVAAATWQERKAGISSLAERVRRCDEALPEDASAQLASLDGTASDLRGISAERDAVAARLSELAAREAAAARESAEAQAAGEGTAGEAKASPAGLVLAALGVAVAVVGMLALAAPVSLIAAALGCVLAVVGVVVFLKARSQARAQASASAQARADAQAKADTLKEARAQLVKAQADLESLEASLRRAMAGAGLGVDGECDVAGALHLVEQRRAGVERVMRDSDDAHERLSAALEALVPGGSEAMGCGDDVLAAATALLASEAPAGCDEDVCAVQGARSAQESFRNAIAPFLATFGIEACDDLAVANERLKQAVSAYEAYRSRAAETQREAQQARQAHAEQGEELAGWAASMGFADGVGALTDEALQAMLHAAQETERLTWQVQQAQQKAREADEKRKQLVAGVEPLRRRFGIAGDADLSASLDALSRRIESRAAYEQRVQLAHEQLEAWDREHAADLEAARDGVDSTALAQLAQAADLVARQRQAVAAERGRCETQRDALLKGLEGYADTAQRVALLSREKQQAASSLFTIQKTAEYLDRARAALDGRYLGGLTERFNDYAATWLDAEDLDMEVTEDFDVSVSEDGRAHEVASYSTGYQDLLDVCLRMALIDTVFETEQPFIVMDDPFVNLDQEKLARALVLLSLLAQGKQIVYFTCHPSRTEAGERLNDGQAKAQFTLPARRASRELPRARARRQAQERARAQAELVASYRVTGATQGRASLDVADARRAITSNMATVRFAPGAAGGSRDNAFDVHFIDAQGRSLCERQTVEVIAGRVVPERARFNLATMQDGGDTYDLIIHEQGKPESELVARIPFKAELAFFSEDLGL